MVFSARSHRTQGNQARRSTEKKQWLPVSNGEAAAPVTQHETSSVGTELEQHVLPGDGTSSWHGCEPRLLVKNSFVHVVFGRAEKRSQSVPPQLKCCIESETRVRSNTFHTKSDAARWCDLGDDLSIDKVSTCPGTPNAGVSDSSDSEGVLSPSPVSSPVESVATPSRLASLRAAGNTIIHALGETDPKQGPRRSHRATRPAVWSQPAVGCSPKHGSFESLSFPPGNFANVFTPSGGLPVPPGKFV